jgi:aminomethyltransferase
MVPFAGWYMSVQYAAGIKAKHLATRNGAGLFDVSHMVQVELPGNGADAFLNVWHQPILAQLPKGAFAIQCC